MSLRRGVSERRACRVLGQHRSTSAMSLGAVTTKSTWSHGSWGLPGTKTANSRVAIQLAGGWKTPVDGRPLCRDRRHPRRRRQPIPALKRSRAARERPDRPRR